MHAVYKEVLRRDLDTFAPQSISLLCWALSFPNSRLDVPSALFAALIVHLSAGIERLVNCSVLRMCAVCVSVVCVSVVCVRA